MVWSEGNLSLKNPVTPPGIDPGTVRPVAQRLNHYATPGPTALAVPVSTGQGSQQTREANYVQCLQITNAVGSS